MSKINQEGRTEGRSHLLFGNSAPDSVGRYKFKFFLGKLIKGDQKLIENPRNLHFNSFIACLFSENASWEILKRNEHPYFWTKRKSIRYRHCLNVITWHLSLSSRSEKRKRKIYSPVGRAPRLPT